MRADRLITLLLLLQRRGQLTAAEAATELEVSERTARRDLEALAMSGVPIYSKAGRGGGWVLLGGATTDLSGLSASEAQSLFLAAGPMLDATPELKSAMRKLTSALPETFRDQAEAASAAIKIDAAGWGQVKTPSGPGRTDANEFLAPLTNAVIDGRQVQLDYESPRSKPSRRVVHPLGMVTKRNVWYLVAQTAKGRRTFRLDRVRAVKVLDALVERPADFDLDAAWAEIVTEVAANRLAVQVQARVRVTMLGPLRWVFGAYVSAVGEAQAGWQTVKLEAMSAESFAGQIAGFGAGVELLDPPSDVVDQLSRITAELASIYGE